MRKSKILGVLICFLFIFEAKAQTQEPTLELLHSIGKSVYINELRATSIAVDSILIVRDDHLTSTNVLLEEIGSTFFIKDFIIFEIDFVDSTRIQLPFTAEIELGLNLLDSLGDTIYTVISLDVEYDTLESNQRLRAIYECESGYLISSQVLSIITAYDWVIYSLRLRNEIHTSRTMENNCLDPILDLTNTDDFADHQELILNWQGIDGVKYDLEWTFIDKYSPDFILYGTLDDEEREALFNNNATRVTLDQNSYVIKLGYSEGLLLYRVRAVQLHEPYIIINGPWTNHDDNNYYCTGLEIDKNWVFKASFAEEGKRSTLISYFDGIGRSRQFNSINESFLTSMISNNYFNKEGLKAFSSLPAPYKIEEENGREILYYANFNRDGNDEEYNFEDVSSDICAIGASIMNTSSGAGRYYSNQSEFQNDYHKFTPDAGGYPFSETIYKNDNTGRIAIQGSSGPTLKINGGHETKYFYAKASQEELYRVFGLDVGNEKYYNKEGVIDPNGQFSVTYKDGKDRIIATALGGESPDALVPLDLSQEENQGNLTVSLIRSEFSTNNQVVESNSIKLSYFFLVTAPGEYEFNYKIDDNPLALFSDCNTANLCYHCKYDIKIVVSDGCDELYSQSFDNYDLNSWNSLCGNPIPNLVHPPITIEFLKAGQYSITKTLTLSSAMKELYLADYIEKASCKTYNDFLLEAIAAISFDDCDMTCEECLSNVGTEFEYLADAEQDYYDNGGVPETWNDQLPEYQVALLLYQELLEKCDALCGNLVGSICNQFLDQMKIDVSPGGQYFLFDDDVVNNVQSCPATPLPLFSVLCTNNSSIPAPYKSLVYLDELNNDIWVETDGGIMKKPNELSLSEFILNFQVEWANTLVQLHPEYCLLGYCETLKEPMKFDEKLSQINSYEAAFDEGVINEFGEFIDLSTAPPSPYNDPIFHTGTTGTFFYGNNPSEVNTRINIIKNILNDYVTINNTSYSALEYAMFLAKDEYDPNMEILNTSTNYTLNDLCEGEKNYVWEFIKAIYLEQKLIAYRGKRPTNCGSAFGSSLLGCAVDGYYQNGFTQSGNACTSPNLIGNGIPRFLAVTPYPVPLSSSIPTVISSVNSQLASEAIQICESYGTYWYDILTTECGYANNLDLSNVLDQFKLICISAVDPTHPMGASDNPNTLPIPLTFQSFQEVLDNYPPPGGSCSSLVIPMPPAYNQAASSPTVLYFNNSISNIPTCVCEALNEVVVEFESTLSTTYTSLLKDELAEYLKRKHNSYLTGEEIQNLLDVCSNSSCKMLIHPISLPDILSCKVCASCEAVRTTIFEFENDPNLIQLNSSIKKEEYLTTYLNRAFGFNYFWQDYFNFLETCKICYPMDDCSEASIAYNDWVLNLKNEQNYPLAVYLNITVGTHRTNAEWLLYFNESCNEMNVEANLEFEPSFLLNCDMLEKVIVNYITYVNIPNVANFYVSLQAYLYNEYWSYLPAFNSIFDGCHFASLLKFHNPDLCNSLQTMATAINSAQPPVINASDALAQDVFLNVFHDKTLIYAKNILRFCGLYNPQVSCSDINTLYNNWLVSDLDEPIQFHEYANAQNSWNYPSVSYSNWLKFCNSSPICKLCYKELLEQPDINDDNCFDMLMSFAQANAQNAWETYLQASEAEFNKVYSSTCIEQLKEQLDMSFEPKEYHYTLYYYDRAGNLFKTIPPQGVKFLDNTVVQDLIDNGTATTNPFPYPLHEYVTSYKYNSYNKVIEQNTPDAGKTTFWYDELGRLVLSQSNAKSIVVNISSTNYKHYSYTLFDPLGRIMEIGKVAIVVTQTPNCTSNLCTYSSLAALINDMSSIKTEIVKTYYDEQLVTSFSQENLLKRVATTTYSDEYSSDPLVYNYATHYSYDISGNVKTVYQENTNSVPDHKIKQIDYVFDLISGKVNKVYYQRSTPEFIKADQFIHSYDYDADNLLKKVSTSMNDDLFVTDANYSYYLHGPLARTLIGERKVQGLDYAYTIQGWLKGLNSGARLAWKDMGRDGWIPPNDQEANPNREVGRDAFSFTLNYFENDYIPVGGMGWHPEIGYSLNDWITPFSGNLYNGNIRSMTNDIQDIDNSILGTAYKYDQLNRIKGTHTIFEPNLSIWKWDENSNENMAYEESGITYDKNGNIKNYIRKDETGSIMDDLEYFLDPSNINNRLDYVSDNISTIFDGDIEPQTQGNYTYDADGNLTHDNIEELNIIWNNFGKVDSIFKDDGSMALGFSYDPSGNRIEKRYYPNGVSNLSLNTYYVRDAQGNVMATYKREIFIDGEKYSLLDWSVYGSARLGLAQVNDNLLWASSNYEPPTWTAPLANNKGIQRSYELTNHLGNVLAVVSDLKTYVDTMGSGQPNYWDYSIANLRTAQDYYPFGMLMPGRNIESESYRFGFNGQEEDDEVKGTGNSLNFKFRMYDTRIARFFAVDPLTKSYPELTPFQFASNTPIWAQELEGLEANYTNDGSAQSQGEGPTNTVSGPLSDTRAEELGYTQYGLLGKVNDATFSKEEIENFSKWNAQEGSGDCLIAATRGCEILTGTSAGWDNSKGNLVLDKQNAWTLGENFENKGFASEVPTRAGSETNAIINSSGNTNGKFSAFLAGPGMANHSIIVTYTSEDVKFSIYDQGTGYDVKNANQKLTQKKFDNITARSGWTGTRMWQLFKSKSVEKIYPRK